MGTQHREIHIEMSIDDLLFTLHDSCIAMPNATLPKECEHESWHQRSSSFPRTSSLWRRCFTMLFLKESSKTQERTLQHQEIRSPFNPASINAFAFDEWGTISFESIWTWSIMAHEYTSCSVVPKFIWTWSIMAHEHTSCSVAPKFIWTWSIMAHEHASCSVAPPAAN